MPSAAGAMLSWVEASINCSQHTMDPYVGVCLATPGALELARGWRCHSLARGRAALAPCTQSRSRNTPDQRSNACGRAEEPSLVGPEQLVFSCAFMRSALTWRRQAAS